ncbi:MAG TPA: T9SS type A sorting domain-containing protein [Bacteroidia bacterium]|jgi:hypothetical protein
MRFTLSFKKITACFLFFLSCALTARASHIAGAEIGYRHISGNTYEVSLNLYVDCLGFDPGATQTINLENTCGAPITMNVNVLNPGGTEVSQVCTAQLGSTVCNGGSLPGMWVFKYSGTVTLPVPCNLWTMSWTVCCRNNAVTNLVNASSFGIYVESKLNTVVAPNNISPSFLSERIPYVCQGQLVNYSCAAFEPDSDSLRYTLVSALDNGAVPLSYSSGYSAASPIPGISIDPASGMLSFTPTTIGSFVVAIRVDEYNQSGILIGSVMRDIQFTVMNCSNNYPSLSSGDISNFSGSALQTGAHSIEMCTGTNFSFDINYSDPNPADVLSYQSNIATVLPGAIVTSTGTNPLTLHVSWTANTSFSGTRYFTTDVNDGSCPIPGIQSYGYAITVLAGTSAGSDITICGNQAANLNAIGGTSFTWAVLSGPAIVVGTNFSCNPCANPVASPAATTVYEVTGNLSGSCMDKDTITVSVVPDFTFSTTQSAISMCLEQSVQFSVTGLTGAYSYSWMPVSDLNNNSIANPVATLDSAGMHIFYVNVTNPAGCSKSDTVSVTVQSVERTSANGDTILCVGQSAALSATGGSSFVWSVLSGPPMNIGSNFSCDTCANVISTPSATTTYQVTSNLGGSCVSMDTVTVLVVPSFTFNASSAPACAGAPTQLNVSSLSPGPGYTYSWSPATFLNDNTLPDPVATIPVSGTYNYTATVTSQAGCSVTDMVQLVVGLTPAIPNVVASDESVCSGSSIQLSAIAGQATPVTCGLSNVGCAASAASLVGTGSFSNTNTTYPAPYGNWYSSVKQQYLYTATELLAAGVTAGKFDQIDFNVASISGISVYNNFSIGITCTNLTSFDSSATNFEAGILTVFPSQSFTIAPGWNHHPFTNAFDWDGNSNIIVEVCMNQLNPGSNYTNNSVSPNDNTSYISCIYSLSDAEDQCPSATPFIQAAMARPQIRFHHCVMTNDTSSYIYSWSPSAGISSPNSQVTSAVVSNTTNYTVTVTDTTSGCSASGSQLVTLDGVNMAIKGSVNYAGTPVTGFAKLFAYASGVQMPMQDSVAITGGNYIFINVPAGDYIIQATADSMMFPLAFPTYYDTVVNWDSADIVSMIICNDTTTANITLLGHPSLVGTNTLAGTLIEGNGYLHSAGMPLADINVVLMDNSTSEALAYTRSNAGGVYMFGNVPSGCYKLYVDIPGLPMDSTYHVCVSGNTSYLDLNYIADANSIFITNSALSVNTNVPDEAGLSVFPNPVIDVLQISNPSGNEIMYELFDITGKCVAQRTLAAGNIISLNTAGLDKGVYILQTTLNGKRKNHRVIKQ